MDLLSSLLSQFHVVFLNFIFKIKYDTSRITHCKSEKVQS